MPNTQRHNTANTKRKEEGKRKTHINYGAQPTHNMHPHTRLRI